MSKQASTKPAIFNLSINPKDYVQFLPPISNIGSGKTLNSHNRAYAKIIGAFNSLKAAYTTLLALPKISAQESVTIRAARDDVFTHIDQVKEKQFTVLKQWNTFLNTNKDFKTRQIRLNGHVAQKFIEFAEASHAAIAMITAEINSHKAILTAAAARVSSAPPALAPAKEPVEFKALHTVESTMSVYDINRSSTRRRQWPSNHGQYHLAAVGPIPAKSSVDFQGPGGIYEAVEAVEANLGIGGTDIRRGSRASGSGSPLFQHTNRREETRKRQDKERGLLGDDYGNYVGITGAALAAAGVNPLHKSTLISEQEFTAAMATVKARRSNSMTGSDFPAQPSAAPVAEQTGSKAHPAPLNIVEENESILIEEVGGESIADIDDAVARMEEGKARESAQLPSAVIAAFVDELLKNAVAEVVAEEAEKSAADARRAAPDRSVTSSSSDLGDGTQVSPGAGYPVSPEYPDSMVPRRLLAEDSDGGPSGDEADVEHGLGSGSETVVGHGPDNFALFDDPSLATLGGRQDSMVMVERETPTSGLKNLSGDETEKGALSTAASTGGLAVSDTEAAGKEDGSDKGSENEFEIVEEHLAPTPPPIQAPQPLARRLSVFNYLPTFLGGNPVVPASDSIPAATPTDSTVVTGLWVNVVEASRGLSAERSPHGDGGFRGAVVARGPGAQGLDQEKGGNRTV